MSSGVLSDRALILVRQHIDSVARLDLLLILYGDPRVRWTAARMGSQMRTPARWATAQMRTLELAGIASCLDAADGSAWSYDPADEEIAGAVQELVEACRRDWPAVTREVMSLRAGGAEAFSDAFRLRRHDG